MQTMWEIYTDGSARPNPGPGGAGVVIVHNGKLVAELAHAGGKFTTNNRMELLAMILAYKLLPKGVPATVHTDSQYVQRGLTEWIDGWIAKGWKKVLNPELWQELLEHKKANPQVEIKWVKAHAGNKWNEYADMLANKGTDKSLGRI